MHWWCTLLKTSKYLVVNLFDRLFFDYLCFLSKLLYFKLCFFFKSSCLFVFQTGVQQDRGFGYWGAIGAVSSKKEIIWNLKVINYILFEDGKFIQRNLRNIQLVRTCLILNWDQDKKNLMMLLLMIMSIWVYVVIDNYVNMRWCCCCW